MAYSILPVDTVTRLETGAVQIVGLGVAAILIVALVAGFHRRRATRPVPDGTSAFLGIAVVATWLCIDLLSTGRLIGTLQFDHSGSAIYALFGVVVGGVAGLAGGSLGDRIAAELYDLTRFDVDGDAVDVLRAAQSVITVTLPDTIETADGYLPLSDAEQRDLAGLEMCFPSRLSHDEIADRIESRILDDYGADYAAVTVGPARVESVVAGTQPQGLGPTIPPGSVVVTINARPPRDASRGDPVDVWEPTDGTPRLVARGEYHSQREEQTALVIDEDAVASISQAKQYRLVTSPASASDLYRFLSTLRSCPETTVTLTAQDEGTLAGEFAGWLPGTVLAIERDGEVIATPADRVPMQSGDRVFLIGHPTGFDDLFDALDDAVITETRTVDPRNAT